MTTEELKDFASALQTLQGIIEVMESRGELDFHAKRHTAEALNILRNFYITHRIL